MKRPFGLGGTMGNLQYTSLAQIFFVRCEKEDFPGWYFRKREQWVYYPRQQLRKHTHFLALALNYYGLAAGGSVGIVANSCPEWVMTDVATQLNHAHVVPLFPNISPENFNFQCDEANVKILLINDVNDLDPAIRELLPRFNTVICLDPLSDLPLNGIYWDEFIHKGETLSRNVDSSMWLRSQLESISADDVFSIIYTSGSTGRPKGVALTHRNMISQLLVLKRDCIKLKKTIDSALVILPIAHVFERMAVYFYLLSGIRVYFADSPRNVAKLAREIRPTLMTVVPRILERVYESMTAAGERSWGLRRWFIDQAIEFAKVEKSKRLFSPLHFIYDKYVYFQMRKAVGGRLRMVICGGGALNKSICSFLINVGIPVYEGYGLTECSPVVCVNRPGQVRPGSVGHPLSHLEVKIGENNEVLVKGESVFGGYLNMPELNRELFTADGFFRTGDQGYFDKDGYLFLTGRLKELFKTSTGKYVSPNPIEMELGRHPLVEQAVVIANNRKFASALIFLNAENAKRLLRRSEVDFRLGKALESKRVHEAIRRHINRVNSKLNYWERIKQWTLVGDNLSVKSGLLTPTLKIRRKAVETRYADLIERMYEEHD